MAKTKPAQILVVTLMIMVVITIAITSIVSITLRNSQQVQLNTEYRRTYNLAESRLLSMIDDVNKNNIHESIGDGSVDFGGNCSVLTPGPQPEFSCNFDESEPGYRSIANVRDTNVIENFELSANEYFNVILNNSVTSLELSWTGQTNAVELVLGYFSNFKDRQLTSIIDKNNVYSLPTDPELSKSGFLTESAVAVENKVIINFSEVINLPAPQNRELNYLRIKNISRGGGTSLSLRASSGASLPNQLRVIDVFSYSNRNVESASPLITTRIPLSPPVSDIFNYSGNFGAVRYPQCGNGIVEGFEHCDDGNSIDFDQCTNDCLDPICKFDQGATGRNEDVVLNFNVSQLAGKLILFDLNVYWEPDWVEVKVVKDGFREEILVPGECYSGADVFADQSPQPGTSKIGYEWIGQETSMDFTYGQCTITSNVMVQKPTLIQNDWRTIVFTIKNGQTMCNAPNTEWQLKVTCPKTTQNLETKKVQVGWAGQCGPGCAESPGGCY